MSAFGRHDWLPGHASVRQGWNGVSWTLSCEFFFYLCAPFLFPWLIDHWRRARLVLAAIWLVLLALSILASIQNWSRISDFLGFHPLPHLIEFILGAVAALQLKHRRFNVPKTAALALMIAPLALYCVLAPESGGYRTGATMIQLFIPGAVLLIFAAANADAGETSSWLQNRVLVFLGEASFSLYMTHALFLGVFVWKFIPFFPGMLQSSLEGELGRVAFVTSAVIIASACFQFVEKPIRTSLLRLTTSALTIASVRTQSPTEARKLP